jgi:hypothetical protein
MACLSHADPASFPNCYVDAERGRQQLRFRMNYPSRYLILGITEFVPLSICARAASRDLSASFQCLYTRMPREESICPLRHLLSAVLFGFLTGSAEKPGNLQV